MSGSSPRRPWLVRRVLAWIDDALPMAPHDRAERDWGPDGETDARRRQERFRQQMLEKRGKGGYR